MENNYNHEEKEIGSWVFWVGLWEALFEVCAYFVGFSLVLSMVEENILISLPFLGLIFIPVCGIIYLRKSQINRTIQKFAVRFGMCLKKIEIKKRWRVVFWERVRLLQDTKS